MNMRHASLLLYIVERGSFGENNRVGGQQGASPGGSFSLLCSDKMRSRLIRDDGKK